MKVLGVLYTIIQSKVNTLALFIDRVESEEDAYQRSYQSATKVAELLQSLRDDVDKTETIVSIDYWPLPTYD